jgi:hypothetical protein
LAAPRCRQPDEPDQTRRKSSPCRLSQAIISAPLYTGCVDDERNFAKPGPNKPRCSRFWVPLIALFCDLRQNEICQLVVSDVRTRPYTPKTNGKAERFIQTALREWAYTKAYTHSDGRTAELPIWLHRYNWHRPHGSLKAGTPISRLGLPEDNLLRLHS